MKVDLEAVSRALREMRSSGATLDQIAGQLQLGPAARKALRTALQKLVHEGAATYHGKRYRPQPSVEHPPERTRTDGPSEGRRRTMPAALLVAQSQRRAGATPEPGPPQPGHELVGTLHLKTEGYGFVSPLAGGGGRENDVFVPPGRSRDALDGDVVRVRTSRGRDGRTIGEVAEVVERRRQLLLGRYRVQAKNIWVEPHDRTFVHPIPVRRDPRAKDGEFVKVRLIREPGGVSGEVIARLGTSGDARFEILASAYAEGFSDEFDRATLLAAESVPDHVLREETAGRRDLRRLPLVTIDGEDARDFDDAVFVSRVGSGYRMVVAIADVAHYVKPGGGLDREGLRRATSVYFPGTVLPMLPERLSNGICSLNPDVDRLCMVCDLALDGEGRALHADIYEAVMRSHARLTYTQVASALENSSAGELFDLVPDLQLAHELSKKLTQMRRERGSIDFDLPEAKIVLAEDGTVSEIVKRPRNDAHRLVEELMLAANEAVARFFDARGLPTVYRIHDQPDEEKLEAFAQLARTHGFELPEKPSAADLNELLHELEGRPQQKALNALLLRAMMQAQYSPDNIGHFGLAAPTYLHFTSPIRRYPDLMVHRLLKEHWARGGQPPRESERAEMEAFLAGVAAQCSDRERAAMKVERDIDAYYAAMFMQDKIDEEYEAVVSGVTERGLYCELAEVFVEGMIPAEELGDSVELDEELHRLRVGNSGVSYGVGDTLRVRVAAADPVRRRITLAPASAPRREGLEPEAATVRPSVAKPRRQAPPGPRRPRPGPARGSPRGRPDRRKRRRDGRR
ncbi:MAG: ribonuclease R [Deltaproteobacteria bacterium]|nr:MAG: ribonuclease R [Deltaproteobacteria bacterium]